MRKGPLIIALIAMTISIIGMMVISAWAVPGVINFQGKLTDPNNESLEGNYFMTFRIYTQQTEGTHLWEEVQGVTVLEGVYDVKLGKYTPLSEDLFDNEELYLEITIFNYSENQNETLSPRQRLTSAPYAMKAAKAADADTLNGQPSSYYAVASESQKRVTGICGPGYSIREIKSDGTVVCETDDVNDAVSDPNGTYIGMSVGYANSASSASSASSANYASTAGNADTVDGKHASDFTTPSTDAGRYGVVSTLYEGNSSLSGLYVNEGQANSISGTMIQNGVVGTSKLANSAVDSTKIASNAVINSKIADNAVTTSKVQDGSIQKTDLNINAKYSLDASDGSPTNRVYVDNSGNVGIGNTIYVKTAGKVGIGETDPSEKLDVNGNIRIKGKHLIHFRRYINLGDNVDYATEFSTNEYYAGIVGFYTEDVDINENGSGDFIEVRMVSVWPTWHIVADLRSHNDDENWEVDVMFVRKELAVFDTKILK